MTQKPPFLILGLACWLLAALAAAAQERPIDAATSKLTVRAFKTGLFSGLADNHEIDAPIKEGSIDEAAAQDIARGHSRGRRHEDSHRQCSNSYGSETNPSSSSVSVSTPPPWLPPSPSGGWASPRRWLRPCTSWPATPRPT